MKRRIYILKWVRQSMVLLMAAVGVCRAGSAPATMNAEKLTTILQKTQNQTSAFLDQLSDMECTENVRQEKLGRDDKVELKEESSYRYLVILTQAGGELSLSEARTPRREAKHEHKASLLLSNGFSTLFLVFHPFYAQAFTFSFAGEDIVNGRVFDKIAFAHIQGMKSPAALSLRAREYPLELSGLAWIDPESGAIARMEAGIQDTLQDVGLKSLHSEIEFAPLPSSAKTAYWFPLRARIEVETPKQHWRNLHQFTEYKKFSVSTQEKVITK